MSIEHIVVGLKKYCTEKGYQVKEKIIPHGVAWEIANTREKTLVNIFNTGKINIQGTTNSLKAEFESIKDTFLKSPQNPLPTEKAVAARYNIITADLQKRVLMGLKSFAERCELSDTPKADTLYRAKIEKGNGALSITQFANGTLLLQGKENKVYDGACDIIEEIANPDEKDVVARFISKDEKCLDDFTSKYSPDILNRAERDIDAIIPQVVRYVKLHDKKWFIASQCLCLADVPLPEFSPLVMPASKAFEGFVKKLCIDIGLVQLTHFQNKKSTIPLKNTDRSEYKSICDREKYASTFLERLANCLDRYRNFMMHSDDSEVTKVSSKSEAIKILADIHKDANEIFAYFTKHFGPFREES